jgi:ferredoxin
MAAVPLAESSTSSEKRVKKTLHRRLAPERSQPVRRAIQCAFLALNVWLAAQFTLFVRHFEVAGAPAISRPPGIEGWLPIAGMMNTTYFFSTGAVPAIHPGALFLFLAFVGASLLFRKSFCGWLCPVGTLSEYLWKLGRRTFGRNFQPPRWLDVAVRGLKYLLLALFVYAVGSMSADALAGFLQSPYGLVADVKMLNFFRYLGLTGAVVLGLLVIASVFVQNFWCRYLCPYGALMGLAALLSPLRIRRTPERCIDCAKCAKACPSRLAVDTLLQIRSAECIGCMECVTACPAEGALDLALAFPLLPARRTPAPEVPFAHPASALHRPTLDKPVAIRAAARRAVPGWALGAGALALFLLLVLTARVTGHWQSPISDDQYRELIPHAQEFSHPGR